MSSQNETTKAKRYRGGCHCGRVRFEVTSNLSQVVACNCTICARTGALRIFVPPEQFKLLSGEAALSDYQFGKKNVHHLFCPACGVHPFGHGTTREGHRLYNINVRCLDEVDVGSLTPMQFDGKSL
jgi:hypothetical protein